MKKAIAVALMLLIAAPVFAVVVQPDNWRTLWIGETPVGGVNPCGAGEDITAYAIHGAFQSAALVRFDLSGYLGGTALSAGTLTVPVTGFFSHTDTPESKNVRIWQLNQYNADADLDDCQGNDRDADLAKPWVDYDGNNLAQWRSGGYYGDGWDPAGFYTVTTGAASAPIDGSPGAPVGSNVVLTIPQATLQDWLDGTLPPIIIFSDPKDIGLNNTFSFGETMTLEFDAEVIPEPAGLGLVGIALLGLKKKRC